jgi:hypothetical protein
MASGKQQSFQYGEVSPSLRYMSDAASYSTGLSKLRNMYVRRTGGVSNRPGLEYVRSAKSQYQIPEAGGRQGVKGYTYWSPFLNKWIEIEVTKVPAVGTLPEAMNFYIDENAPVSVSTFDTEGGKAEVEKIRFTMFNESIFISPGIPAFYTYAQEGWADINVCVEYGLNNKGYAPTLYQATGIDYTGYLDFTHTTQGTGPYFPVSYLVTAVFKDGQEIVICQKVSAADTGTLPVMVIAYPNANVQNKFTLVLDPSASADIKFINLYRASGRGGIASSMYSLVGRQKYGRGAGAVVTGTISNTLVNGITNIASTTAILVGMELITNAYFPAGTKVVSKTATTVTLNNYWSGYPSASVTFTFASNAVVLNDYGAEDASITPPIDSSFMGMEIAPDPFTPWRPDTIPNFCGGQAAAYYQQRAVIALRPGVTEATKIGTILVSKIGAPKQLKSPIIFSDTEAFTISLPITDGTPCVALLSMERLMAFTEKGVYVIRGGEQGILTPTQVNPLLVSEEGCSAVVEPKMAGKQGYFINSAHTKLMAITFGVDGNLDIKEASLTSPELLAQDIVEIEIIRDTEDTVYLLRRDGKLVRVTSTEEGIHGFSIIETDGYIESIYRGKQKKMYVPNSVNESAKDRYYDTLMCYVIRNGNRILERLNIREDAFRENEIFADCSNAFGLRLSEYGELGYFKVGQTSTVPLNPRIKLVAPTAWTAGNTIEIWTTNEGNIFLPFDGNGVIHFYYEDEEGKTQTLEYYKLKNTTASTAEVNIEATATIQNIKYTSFSGGYAQGDDKNEITIEYIDGGIAGSESVVVEPYKIRVYIQSGVSTANQILAKINASLDAMNWINASITGSGATAQLKVGATKLQGGIPGYTQKFSGYCNVDVPEVLRNVVAQEAAGKISTAEMNKRTTRWLPAFNFIPSPLMGFGVAYALSDITQLGIGGDFTGTPSIPTNTITNVIGGLSSIVIGTILKVAGYSDNIIVTNVNGTTITTNTNFTHSKIASINIRILYPVSIFADGEVLSSPLNPYKPTIYMEKEWQGEYNISLPGNYAWGYVGLPYTAEMETLDLETAGERTLTDSNKLLNSVGTAFLNTRGGFVGMQDQSLENMQEIVVREDESFNNQTENFNGHIVTHIPAEWNEKGRINIKQVDPAPITVLSVYPKGISGD